MLALLQVREREEIVIDGNLYHVGGEGTTLYDLGQQSPHHRVSTSEFKQIRRV